MPVYRLDHELVRVAEVVTKVVRSQKTAPPKTIFVFGMCTPAFTITGVSGVTAYSKVREVEDILTANKMPFRNRVVWTQYELMGYGYKAVGPWRTVLRLRTDNIAIGNITSSPCVGSQAVTTFMVNSQQSMIDQLVNAPVIGTGLEGTSALLTSAVGSVLLDAWSATKQTFQSFFDAGRGLGASDLDAFIKGFESGTLGTAQFVIDGLLHTATDVVEDAVDVVGDVVDDAADLVVDAAEGAVDTASDVVNGIGGALGL